MKNDNTQDKVKQLQKELIFCRYLLKIMKLFEAVLHGDQMMSEQQIDKLLMAELTVNEPEFKQRSEFNGATYK